MDFPRSGRFSFIRLGFFLFRGRTSRRNSKVRSPLGMTNGAKNKKVVSNDGVFTRIFSQLSNGSFFFFLGWSNVWFQQIVTHVHGAEIWWVGRRFSVGWLLQHLDTFVMEKRTQQGMLWKSWLKLYLCDFLLQYGADVSRTWRILLLCFDRAWYRRSGELKHWWTLEGSWKPCLKWCYLKVGVRIFIHNRYSLKRVPTLYWYLHFLGTEVFVSSFASFCSFVFLQGF